MALCSAYLLASLGTVVGEPAQLWLEAIMFLFTGSFSAAIVWRTTVNYRRQRRTAAQPRRGPKQGASDDKVVN